MTDELANVLIRADGQNTVILNRLAEWETEKLNVFPEDLAGTEGQQLVAFFGEHAEGVRAWEVLINSGLSTDVAWLNRTSLWLDETQGGI